MDADLMYKIIGGLLALNAYFLKGLVSNLNDLKIQLTKLNTEHSLLSKLSSAHDKDIRTLRDKMHKVGNDLGEIMLHREKIEQIEIKINDIKLQIKE